MTCAVCHRPSLACDYPGCPATKAPLAIVRRETRRIGKGGLWFTALAYLAIAVVAAILWAMGFI